MNTRKFYFILTTIMTSFLFISGVYMLYLINITSAAGSDEKDSTNQEGFFDKIIQPFVLDKSPVNILLLGGDKVAGNTDTMMLINFNPDTAQINILSVPRDSRVMINGMGYEKINAAYPKGGPDLAVRTVSNFLNTCIQYYVYVDTAAFRDIIDMVDGVDYYVPIDMDYDDPIQNLHIHLAKGQQHLNGKKAEQFMRFRHPNHYTQEIMKYYDGSDIKRIQAQQSFIKELIRQKTSLKYLTRLNDIISRAFSSLNTNLTLSDALKLAQNINKLDINQIIMKTVPGDPDVIINGIWYYAPDKAETKSIVEQYFHSDLGTAPEYSDSDDEPDVEAAKSYTQTQKNPSNKNTGIKGSSTPQP